MSFSSIVRAASVLGLAATGVVVALPADAWYYRGGGHYVGYRYGGYRHGWVGAGYGYRHGYWRHAYGPRYGLYAGRYAYHRRWAYGGGDYGGVGYAEGGYAAAPAYGDSYTNVYAVPTTVYQPTIRTSYVPVTAYQQVNSVEYVPTTRYRLITRSCNCEWGE